MSKGAVMESDRELLERILWSVDNEFGGFRTELRDLRADLGDLRAEVGDLRAEVGVIRADVVDLRADLGELHYKFGLLSATVEELSRNVLVLSQISQATIERVASLEGRVLALENRSHKNGDGSDS